MTDSIILHHYEMSPYAEKIRLMFGITGGSWQSLLSPAWPPRPNVDPLAGGYRRIPVAQIGADIFCDSGLITEEIARISQCEALNPATVSAQARELMTRAEKEVFFAAVGAVPPLRLIGTLLKAFGPLDAYRFVKDRSSLMKGGARKARTAGSPKKSDPKETLRSFIEALELQLAEDLWLSGDSPTVADLCAYHPLWLNVATNRQPLDAGPNVRQWYARVAELGHGDRKEIDQATAFASAKQSEPRPLPADVILDAEHVGEAVSIAPSDYGTVPVTGVLAGVTAGRLILARDTTEFGLLHVHFPRAGYAVTS